MFILNFYEIISSVLETAKADTKDGFGFIDIDDLLDL